MPRETLPSQHQRSHVVLVRLTPSERQKLVADAAGAKTLSDYVRAKLELDSNLAPARS